VIALPDRVAGDVRTLVAELGEIFLAFDDDESGCLVTGLADDAGEWCVKHAVNAQGAAAQARALAVHDAVQHPALVAPVRVVDGDHGPIVVYPWIRGERLRMNPMVKELPTAARLAAIDAIIEVHALINDADFVSIDLYDGNLIYDGRVHVIDIDEYRPAPFVLETDRTLGSTRFMAPEEFRRGATLDSRTTVFQLGRTAAVFFDPPEGTIRDRLPAAIAPVVARATAADPNDRFEDAGAMLHAWRSALHHTTN
jgi:serine/threonine-protein kinase